MYITETLNNDLFNGLLVYHDSFKLLNLCLYMPFIPMIIDFFTVDSARCSTDLNSAARARLRLLQ